MTQVTKAQQSYLRDEVANAMYDGAGNVPLPGHGRRTETQGLLDQLAEQAEMIASLRSQLDESVRVERNLLDMNYWIVLPYNSGGTGRSDTYETFEQADQRARELALKHATGTDYVVLKTQYGYFRQGGGK